MVDGKNGDPIARLQSARNQPTRNASDAIGKRRPRGAEGPVNHRGAPRVDLGGAPNDRGQRHARLAEAIEDLARTPRCMRASTFQRDRWIGGFAVEGCMTSPQQVSWFWPYLTYVIWK